MKNRSNTPLFFLVGYFGHKNMGDQAMLYAILEQMDILFPTASFRILSKENEPNLQSRYGSRIDFVPLRPVKVLQNLCASSSVILAGGTHLEDHGTSTWRSYKNFSRILLLALASKLLHKPLYHLGVGVGPLARKTSRLIAKCVGTLSTLICVRDPDSRELLKELGLGSKTILGFDPSVLLASSTRKTHSADDGCRTTLGLSLLPYFTIYNNSAKMDETLVAHYAEAINTWLVSDDNSRAHLFAFNGEERYDAVMIDKLWEELLAINPALDRRIKKIDYVDDPERMLDLVAQCTHFVSFRYHSAVFAYNCKLPCLMVSYHPKCLSFAKQVELPSDAVITPEQILAGALSAKLADLTARKEKFRARVSVEDAKSKAKAAFSETFFA
jgi:polysaccharide pyruvyl transferase WcaK-like protein